MHRVSIDHRLVLTSLQMQAGTHTHISNTHSPHVFCATNNHCHYNVPYSQDRCLPSHLAVRGSVRQTLVRQMLMQGITTCFLAYCMCVGLAKTIHSYL